MEAPMTREYFRNRREQMKARGICVDCQKRPVEGEHVCCGLCLEARRVRERARWQRVYASNAKARWELQQRKKAS
jgi:hypothetical protein